MAKGLTSKKAKSVTSRTKTASIKRRRQQRPRANQPRGKIISTVMGRTNYSGQIITINKGTTGEVGDYEVVEFELQSLPAGFKPIIRPGYPPSVSNATLHYFNAYITASGKRAQNIRNSQ